MPATLKSIDTKVWNICLFKKKNKDYPAAVVGALYHNCWFIEETAFPPPPIALQLYHRLSALGDIGSERNGNKIGKCAEVGAANKILRTRPTLPASRINFTNAYRPRTMDKVPTCINCIDTFK